MRLSLPGHILLTALLFSFSQVYGQQKTTTQRETMSIPAVQSGGGLGIDLRGAGVPIGVFEAPLGGNTSIDTSNSDLSHVTVIDGGGSSSHATTVTEILTSKGVANASELGVAPDATVYSYGREASHEAFATELGNAIESYNLLLSNHSYADNYGWSDGGTWQGVIDMSETEDYKFGYYGDYSRTVDSLMFEYPYHLVVRATANNRGDSNTTTPFNVYSGPSYSVVSRSSPNPEANGGTDGYDGLGRDATSKNALIIGAVNNISGGYSVPADISFANSKSAWGLTDDGRVKPDLVGPGQLTSGTAYTSYASPMITGLGALLQELNRAENGRWLKSASLKGLLIHTADPGTSDGSPLPTMGWGVPNAETAASFLINSDGNQRLIEGEIENGETVTFRFYHDGTGDFRATLVWTDPHGTSPTLDFNSSDLDDSTAILVHDLDMELWDEAGTPSIHAYPWKMSTSHPENAATRGDNNVDNVERIDFPAASMSAGWYSIRVSHDGSITGKQEFSLLISDAEGVTFTGGAWSSDPSTWEAEVMVRILDTVNTAHIRSSVSVSFLEMEPGADLYVHQPQELSITGEMLMKANAYGTAQAKGNVLGVVHRQTYLAGAADWRYLWSPLRTTVGEWTEELTRANLSGSSSPSVYSWDAANTQWNGLSASDSAHEGALVLYTGTNAFAEFTALPFAKSSRGRLDKRQRTFSLTVDNDGVSSDDDLGWNLIGHPYLAPVDWQSLDVSQTSGSFYIWNNAESDFAVSDGTVFSNGGRRYIYPGQCFWVYCASGSTGSLLMDSAAVVLSTDEAIHKRVYPQVRVTVHMANGMTESAVLELNPNSSPQFDFGLDFPDREGGDPKRVSLCWKVEGEDMVIARTNEESGFADLSYCASDYEIDSVSVELVQCESLQFRWAVDSSYYTIDGIPPGVWDSNCNLQLQWSSSLADFELPTESSAFSIHGNRVYWSGSESISAEVIDMNGRVVSVLEWENAGYQSLNLMNGAYLLRSEEGHLLKFVQ